MKNISKPWKKIAATWQNITSPSRPSEGELEVFESKIKSKLKHGSRVLILGSTPEFRIMLSKYPSKVFLIDVNWEMTLAMTEIAAKIDPDKEVWVKSSWTEDVFLQNHFDVILGDFTFGNLSFADQNKFFTNVCKCLKEDGLYLERVLMFIESLPVLNYQDLLRYFSPANQSYSNAALLWSMGIFLMDNFNKDRQVKVSDFLDLLKSKDTSGELRKIIDFGNKPLWPNDKSWFIMEKNNLFKKIQAYFKILEVVSEKQVNYPKIYKEMIPILVMKKL